MRGEKRPVVRAGPAFRLQFRGALVARDGLRRVAEAVPADAELNQREVAPAVRLAEAAVGLGRHGLECARVPERRRFEIVPLEKETAEVAAELRPRRPEAQRARQRGKRLFRLVQPQPGAVEVPAGLEVVLDPPLPAVEEILKNGGGLAVSAVVRQLARVVELLARRERFPLRRAAPRRSAGCGRGRPGRASGG